MSGRSVAYAEVHPNEVMGHILCAPHKSCQSKNCMTCKPLCAGEMSDAAEVLGAIYEQLAELPKIGTLATQVFELPVREAVHCPHCGKDTHQSSFVQSFYCVSATALRMQAMLALADNVGIMPPLGELLLVSHPPCPSRALRRYAPEEPKRDYPDRGPLDESFCSLLSLGLAVHAMCLQRHDISLPVCLHCAYMMPAAHSTASGDPSK